MKSSMRLPGGRTCSNHLHRWKGVVPAHAGTHNHRPLWLTENRSVRLLKEKPRRMGPCFPPGRRRSGSASPADAVNLPVQRRVLVLHLFE